MLLLVAVVSAVLIFGSGIAGLFVQKLLPDEHKSDASRDLLQRVAGLVGLLLALTLGIATGTSYSYFTTQQSELESLSAQALLLDQALAQYGPETQPARAQLKDVFVRGYKLFWGGGDADPAALTVAGPLARLRALSAFLDTLEPKTEAQKEAQTKARELNWSLTQARLLMSLQVASPPISWSLMAILLFWAIALFFTFSLNSSKNATVVAALAFGAFSAGCAMFLILELARPYTGLFRVSPGALQQTIEFLDLPVTGAERGGQRSDAAHDPL